MFRRNAFIWIKLLCNMTMSYCHIWAINVFIYVCVCLLITMHFWSMAVCTYPLSSRNVRTWKRWTTAWSALLAPAACPPWSSSCPRLRWSWCLLGFVLLSRGWDGAVVPPPSSCSYYCAIFVPEPAVSPAPAAGYPPWSDRNHSSCQHQACRWARTITFLSPDGRYHDLKVIASKLV